MWTVMMIVMMLPTAVPFVWTYWRLAAARAARTPRIGATFSFVAGYLLPWAAFSLGATMLLILLDRGGELSPSMAIRSANLSGALMLAVGVYQFTPLKDACARNCRTPIGFFIARWRDGSRGAVAMGIKHGIYCVGCCWLLMAIMFVVGVMNLTWMAILTAVVLIKKLPRIGPRLGKAVGWMAVAAGISLLAMS